MLYISIGFTLSNKYKGSNNKIAFNLTFEENLHLNGVKSSEKDRHKVQNISTVYTVGSSDESPWNTIITKFAEIEVDILV